METMPRAILLLVTDLQIGGTPTVVRELAIRLNAPPSVRVDVACLAGLGPVADQLQSAGVRVFPLNARGITDVAVFGALRRLISAERHDTVLSFLLHANAVAAVVKPFFTDVRFLQSIQTTQPSPRWHWLVQSLVHHAAERVVVPSPSVAAFARGWADVPPDKLIVIPNAIEMAQCDTGFEPVAEAHLPDDSPLSRFSRGDALKHGLKTRVTGRPFTLGFIGRLDPIKRIPDLVRAAKLLGNRVRLDIFGEGSERQHIEKLIRELDVVDRVTLHGVIADSRSALQQIDVLVLPSAAEGFGLVLIEAMAAGVPVIATKVPGIRDVVRDGQTGLLVPPFAPAQLAGAIDRVLRDQILRSRLVAQARDDVARRFSWDVVLPQYRALLDL
jgi:glycosyltransferase involved in cell wall biosynthesis